MFEMYGKCINYIKSTTFTPVSSLRKKNCELNVLSKTG